VRVAAVIGGGRPAHGEGQGGDRRGNHGAADRQSARAAPEVESGHRYAPFEVLRSGTITPFLTIGR
jgi:hypothetical protein